MDDQLTPSEFEARVGDQFQVREAGGCTIVLDQLDEHPPDPGSPRGRPFTLTFVGEAGEAMPQGTYSLHHTALGEMAIFLVPVGPGGDGRHRYAAVFN